MTQWEGAIDRDNAAYRLIEKNGKMTDLMHRISHNGVEAKKKEASFDD